MAMRSREDGLVWLGELLDRLGPGVFLHVDDMILKSLFPSTVRGVDQAAVKTFAEQHACAIRYEKQAEQGVFGRAYFKDTYD